MALKVWIPGTTDISDQGLGGTAWTNSGVTINDSGKLGKCIYSGTSGYMTASNFNISTKWSYSCWWKDANTSAGWQYIFLLHNGTSNDSNSQLAFLSYPTQSRCEVCSNGKWYSTQSYTPGTWNHIGATYDGTTCKVYFNGKYTTSFTPGQTITGTNLQIFKGANVYVNDIRIWDNEVLSPREVTEIAKGLVLHYPLNREGFGQDNLLSRYVSAGSNAPGSTASAGKTAYYGDYGITISSPTNADTYFRLFLKEQLVQNEIYTISCHVSGLSSGTYYNFPLFAQGNSSMGLLQINHNGLCYLTFTMTYSTQNSVSVNGETLYICFMDDYTRNVASGQGDITITNFKIEKGNKPTPWTPNSSDTIYSSMGLNSNIVYDCSGYRHDGTASGSIAYSSDALRYSVSTKFDKSYWIWCTSPTSEVQSVSLWIKVPSLTDFVAFVDEQSRLGFGYYSSYFIAACDGHTTIFKTTLFSVNQWNHIVVTKNGTARSLYINGQAAEIDSSRTDSWTHSANYLMIGRRNANTSYMFSGNISDFRMYATALTAQQVLELYQTPISLAYNGVLLSAELQE